MPKLRLAWFTELSSRLWDEGAKGWGFGHSWGSPDYYLDVARALDRGLFDLLITADVNAVKDFKGSIDKHVRYGETIGFLSPHIIMAAMSTVTRTLGLVPTISTLDFHPYTLARELATLDHMTRGRTGWNIVTSTSNRAAQNYGMDVLPAREERYERATEFLEVCEKLWNSWDPDAVVMDPATLTFARPGSIREINHSGKWFKVRGPLMTRPGPQGRPLYVQAGGSPTGQDFAAKHADVVLSHGNTVEAMRNTFTAIKGRAAKFGRRPEDVKVIFTFKPFIGGTHEEAAAKRQRYYKDVSDRKPEISLLNTVNKAGVDLSELDLDAPLPATILDNMATGSLGWLKQHNPAGGAAPTLRHILAAEGVKESYPLFGTPTEIVDTLQELHAQVPFDGIAIREVMSPLKINEIIDNLVPELQKRGMLRTSFRKSTLRENFFDEDA